MPPGGQPPGGQPPGGQGGWGQPPGAPPGGYGAPPGGYGGPPGAPQGWPPPQQQPPVGAPGPAPKSGKANPLLWVGLGCGALLLIGAAGVAWAYFTFVRPAQELAKAAAAASSLGATISVGDGGVTVKLPGLDVTAPTATTETTPATPTSPGGPRAGTPLPSGSASAAPSPTTVNLTPGGPSCAAAAACCKAMLEKTGATAQVGQCEQLKSAPEFGCAQALATYRKTAPLVGASCP